MHPKPFGCALRDDFRPGESDLDLLVEFGPMELYARVDTDFGLRDDFRVLLGQEIDLVMAGAVKSPATSNALSNCSIPSNERAYLSDILGSCAPIMAAVQGMNLAAYQSTRPGALVG